MILPHIHRAPGSLCQVIAFYFARPVGNVESRMLRVVEFERTLVA